MFTLRQPGLSIGLDTRGFVRLRCPFKPPTRRLPRRLASTFSKTTPSTSLSSRIKSTFYTTAFLLTLTTTYLYATDTRSSVHRYVLPPILRAFYPDPEDAHHATLSLLSSLYSLHLHPRERPSTPFSPSGSKLIPQQLPKSVETPTVLSYPLSSPIAISAGLDKDALAPDALFALGPSILEVGGITPLPQPGNDKPRVFRLASGESLINRYGLNSAGADAVSRTLQARVRRYAGRAGYGYGKEGEEAVLNGRAGVSVGGLGQGQLLAVQIAKNAGTDVQDVDAVIKDYVYCVERVGRYADIIVVNVSSPNTVGLRGLQAADVLSKLLNGVVGAAKKVEGRAVKPGVMVKVSPDEDGEKDIEGVCEAVWEAGVDGVIVANTTKSRPGADQFDESDKAVMAAETGGFSGPSMFEKTKKLVKRYREGLDAAGKVSNPSKGGAGRKIIFASGGITDGKKAAEVLHLGASVAMVYTALVFGGAGTITRIKSELQNELNHR